MALIWSINFAAKAGNLVGLQGFRGVLNAEQGIDST